MDKKRPTVLFLTLEWVGLAYIVKQKLLPNWHYLYCFDNAGFPYSEREERSIIHRTLAICQLINQRYPLDAIVIACNTASTVVLPLRANFDIPIIGTVPALNLHQGNKDKNILVYWRRKGL